MRIRELVKALQPLVMHDICYQDTDGMIIEQWVEHVAYLEPIARLDQENSVHTVIAENGWAGWRDGRLCPNGVTFPTRKVAAVREIAGGLLLISKSGRKMPVWILEVSDA